VKINEFHVWSLSSGKTRAIIHITTEDISLVGKIKKYLNKKHKIENTTVEIEFSNLED
jgi:Co/Zn/Cd efflux system component